jgi:hypothetical protein
MGRWIANALCCVHRNPAEHAPVVVGGCTNPFASPKTWFQAPRLKRHAMSAYVRSEVISLAEGNDSTSLAREARFRIT